MGLDLLSSRDVIGSYYRALEVDRGESWVPKLAMEFSSDKESETYKWLGQVPAFRQWIGGRQAKGFDTNGISVTNLPYETTLKVDLKDLERDKTGQIMVRINDLATRTNSHDMQLLSTLIADGSSALCYDGQYFFDTDHTEGNNTTSQSNDISVDISALPAAVHGSTTEPSAQEMALSILQGITQIYSFKDNENQPMNEQAKEFIVMVPPSLWPAVTAAVGSMTFGGGETNVLMGAGFSVKAVMNSRLSFTDSFAIFRTDGNVKPFILQIERPVRMKAKAEGSEYEMDYDAWQFGVDKRVGVGYGYWQHACLVTMV